MNIIGKANFLPLYRAEKDQSPTVYGSKIIFISLGLDASFLLILYKTANLYWK